MSPNRFRSAMVAGPGEWGALVGGEFPSDLFDTEWAAEVERRELRRHRRSLRRRRLTPGRRTGIAWLIGVVCATVLVPLGLIGMTALTAHSRPAYGGLPSSHAVPTPTAPLNETARVDTAHPFEATPAKGWQEGIAGIVPPPPAPLGKYSADQVGDALERVRQLVATSRLDPQVIAAHDFEPALRQLAPGAAAKLRPEVGPGQEWEVGVSLSDRYHLLPVAPRVIGSMRTGLGDDGMLTVHTDYLIAYAFSPPDVRDLNGPMDIVVVDRAQVDYQFVDDRAHYAAADQGIWIGKAEGSSYSINCDEAEKGFLAPAFSGRSAGPGFDSRSPKDYFDPNLPLPTGDGCR